MPIVVAFLISVICGFILYPKISFHDKTEEFSKGAGDSGIMLMILIFLLAGAFANLSKSIGAVDSTVNFALSYIPPRFLFGGLFLTACFISLSLGTSVGTVVALAPIAVGINDSIPNTLSVSLAAVVGGAMFGDNLSMISDTTIAATRTQNVEMRAKFKVNFWIALPAAVVTFIIYSISSDLPQAIDVDKNYSFIKIIPYLFVFGSALLGLHVIWVLISGIVITAGIGLVTSDTGIWKMVSSMNEGMASMFELSIICVLIGGVVNLIKFYGGIDFILRHVSRRVSSVRSGELGIALLTALVNITLANNTITILIVGPLAKNIADKNGIDPRRSASILDTVSCVIQGVLPYGAQILAAVAVAHQVISPVEILDKLYYPYLLGISTLAFIYFKRKK
jgi:Na+/H+ antiporter NhaC